MGADSDLAQYATGVYPSDRLPKLQTLPSCLIANTDPAGKPGKHWVALYVCTDGTGEFFDSYGRPPTPNFAKFLRKYCNSINHNSVRVQGPLSSSCGQFCIYYLAHRVRGRTMKKIVNDFCTDLVLNDIYAAEYVRRNFNVKSDAYDFDFSVCQCCKPE